MCDHLHYLHHTLIGSTEQSAVVTSSVLIDLATYRNLASIIISDVRFYPKFLEFCRPACYVDEHYFPTLLTIRAPKLLANRSLTWVDWSRGGPHPATFGANDITEVFMQKLHEGRECLYNDEPSTVCYLFARKFAPSTLQRLLLFAQEFLGY
ncbi:putative core-2/I-branching beta-1,6-N-acetylglucosaminyltransferase family protein [Tanacetum coccineum]